MHLWQILVMLAVIVPAILLGAMVWSEERRRSRDTDPPEVK